MTGCVLSDKVMCHWKFSDKVAAMLFINPAKLNKMTAIFHNVTCHPPVKCGEVLLSSQFQCWSKLCPNMQQQSALCLAFNPFAFAILWQACQKWAFHWPLAPTWFLMFSCDRNNQMQPCCSDHFCSINAPLVAAIIVYQSIPTSPYALRWC